MQFYAILCIFSTLWGAGFRDNKTQNIRKYICGLLSCMSGFLITNQASVMSGKIFERMRVENHRPLYSLTEIELVQ